MRAPVKRASILNQSLDVRFIIMCVQRVASVHTVPVGMLTLGSPMAAADDAQHPYLAAATCCRHRGVAGQACAASVCAR
eukprot:6190319-Pleurochrysis_carterae.AAC.2